MITFKPGEQTQQRHSILVSCLLKKRYKILFGFSSNKDDRFIGGNSDDSERLLTYFFKILRINHLTPFGDFKGDRFNIIVYSSTIV